MFLAAEGLQGVGLLQRDGHGEVGEGGLVQVQRQEGLAQVLQVFDGHRLFMLLARDVGGSGVYAV